MSATPVPKPRLSEVDLLKRKADRRKSLKFGEHVASPTTKEEKSR